MTNDLLVSCTVVSYNSAATVIETLESIKAQTYQNIELIVSDDCSTDNTVELCREWLKQNNDRFARTVLLTVEKNTGVAGNDNRALAECQGTWQKGIAADDILFPNCVEDFVEYVKSNPEVRWAASKVAIYNEKFEEDCCRHKGLVYDKSFFDTSVEQQLMRIAWQNVIIAPSVFYNLDFKRLVGGYDESYGFEDYPFYVNALEKGYKCYFLDKVTVGYRIHQSQYNSSDRLFNYPFLKKERFFIKDRCFVYLNKKQRFLKRLFWHFQDSLEIIGLNRKKPKFIGKFYKSFEYVILKLA